MRLSAYLLLVTTHLQIATFCAAQRYVGDGCSGPEGRNGVCQLISNCRSAQEDIRKGIRPKICGFQGRDPIVCCLSSGPSPVTSRVPGETAKKWCQGYKTPCYSSDDSLPQKPVVGGIPALSREFPHMAAIGYGDETDIKWYCGGTLISEKFVLTAAHCISSQKSGPAKWVLLGAVKLINTTATDGRNGQIHPITGRIRHPEYRPPANYNDIALFEIGPAVTPNPSPMNTEEIHPACLSENRTFPGSMAVATGWGKVGHFDDGSSDLLKVTLDIFDQSVCQEAFDVEIKTTSSLKNGIVSTMLCAGVPDGKRDTCQGDSGGPLQYSIIGSCMYEVWGVTSFGKVCGFANSPAVYTKVFEYVPWIEDIVWAA